MSVVLNLPYTLCIWISAAAVIIYTLLGGLYSVAYTDIIQLVLIFISLWLCVPFVLMNPKCLDISETLMNNTLHAPWIGAPGLEKTGIIMDEFLMFGGGANDPKTRTRQMNESFNSRPCVWINDRVHLPTESSADVSATQSERRTGKSPGTSIPLHVHP
ncbi:unnamed protein product [Pleuronectes platessa]|uniref:Uncharacterized protein n=1 Tax=Pleuronectes platessa TaxID=8262 RepID=A0A9N7U8K9_PLEPL|nr:unnamed protein product [Pleuronectes platessa]